MPILMVAVIFLSTLPARGATKRINALGQTYSISIHAPREGSDVLAPGNDARPLEFLSTLPARGATCSVDCAITEASNFYPRSPRGERQQLPRWLFPVKSISIHAPREGSDVWPQRGPGATQKFLSTLPARGATGLKGLRPIFICISIHAPREGSDTRH